MSLTVGGSVSQYSEASKMGKLQNKGKLGKFHHGLYIDLMTVVYTVEVAGTRASLETI